MPEDQNCIPRLILENHERIDESQMSQAGSDWIRVDGDGARLDWIRIEKWIEMDGEEHKSESHTLWLSLLCSQHDPVSAKQDPLVSSSKQSGTIHSVSQRRFYCPG